MTAARLPTPVDRTWPLLCAALAGGSEALALATTTRVLAQLDHVLDDLADALKVEYFGPEVGLGQGHGVYRLVVRQHALGAVERQWGLRICTALPHAGWRADWALAAAGRQRRGEVVAALPLFFAGYWSAVVQAAQDTSRAGQRLQALSASFTAGETQGP